MTDSTLKEVLEHIIDQGTYNGSFYELNIPSFITSDNKEVQCVATSCKYEHLDDPISLEDHPMIVFFANPGEKEAIHRAYEKDFTVTDFNKIVTLTLNTDKKSHLKVSAEDKLEDVLEQYGINDWHCNGEGIYYGISESGCVICARYDKEDSADSTSGIRLEIYPPYDSLRNDDDFIKYMKKDIMEGGNWASLGKFVNWCETGNEECRPVPMDMYYSNVADVISGVEILYIEDEYESVEQKEEKPELILTNIKPYSNMLKFIKADILELIETEVLENGAQVDPKMEIAYADTECGLECNHTDNTIGVVILPNQDDKEQLELCFIHGTKFESPDYSTDVPLRDFPVESLINIYNNLK